MKQSFFQQSFSIILTLITFIVLTTLLYFFIHILNIFPLGGKILLQLRIADILIGLTIYLKTSVDFALFIGKLMSKYNGLKSRIAIEIGTALGNALGTFFVLSIWIFFKEVPILMIFMILLASLVLLTLAEEGLSEFQILNFKFQMMRSALCNLQSGLHIINSFLKPFMQFLVPHAKENSRLYKTFLSLLLFSLTIPLILGLDDFAGYIPLFTIVNVFGFAVGVFLGHMLLNIALFASPTHTIRVVKQPLIALLGSLAFIGISLWGFVEILKIVQTLF